jgi:hypothetical protein
MLAKDKNSNLFFFFASDEEANSAEIRSLASLSSLIFVGEAREY